MEGKTVLSDIKWIKSMKIGYETRFNKKYPVSILCHSRKTVFHPGCQQLFGQGVFLMFDC